MSRRGIIRVMVDAVDPAGRFINEAETDLALIGPGLDREKIKLSQTAPGRYEAAFATPQSGAYHLQLSQQQNGAVTFRQTRGVVVGYPDELRLGQPDEALMRRIADVSGGRYAPDVASLFADDERVAQRATPLWPYLLLAALAVFVFDVALRRIDFSTWGSRR